MLVVCYQFLGGPMDGQEFSLPFHLLAPPRIYKIDEMGNPVGHYYLCMDGDPLGPDYRPAYAWKETL